MRICQVLFSTNRLEFLTRTLESQKKLNWEGCEVDKIFIDDYPKGRNNLLVSTLVQSYGYNELYLHNYNLGISLTWQLFFENIKNRGYDYIWHQEDDAEIVEPIRILDLVNILETDKSLSQLQLKRNNWYKFETEEIGPRDTDTIRDQYRIERGSQYFWMMASLCPAWIAKENYVEETKSNAQEWVIARLLQEKYGMNAGILKTQDGNIMVNHIGEYNRGKKVLPGEPGYELFIGLDPEKSYDARTWEERI